MASRTLLPLIKRAREGDVDAQLSLGRHYLAGGQGVARNLAAAAGWLARAFAAGNAEAGRLLAEETPATLCEDAALFRRACQQAAATGSARALAALAALREAAGLPALDDWLAAARAGDLLAARRVGELLLAAGDAAGARPWLSAAAAGGDAPAAAALADLLWRTGDPAARAALEKTAATGDVEAMFRLGALLADADECKQGAAWLKRAAGLGHGRAMRRLAGMYAHIITGEGGGLRTDPGRAIPLLERAAAAGVVEAWWDLARIYDLPRFAGRDPRRARECLERAAREHVAPAQLALGVRLAAREKDLTAWLAAGRWLTLAQEAGEAAAADVLATIADTADAVAAATDATAAVAAALTAVRLVSPLVAARLWLASEFALTEREALCLDMARVDQGWCLLADVSAHFRYKPWRLICVERPSQREALAEASTVCRDVRLAADDLTGELRARSRRLARLLEHLTIDARLFFR